MRNCLILLFLSPAYILLCQKIEPFRIDSFLERGVYLNSGWKYRIGDKPEFAHLDYVDTAWQPIANFRDLSYLPQIPENGDIFWLRLTLKIDTIVAQPLAMMIEQTGASEIYLNGKRLYQFGILSKNPSEIKGFSPHLKPYLLPLDTSKNQVLAVRYAIQPNLRYAFFMGHANRLIRIRVSDFEETMSFYQEKYVFNKNTIFKVGVFSILSIMFLTFYFFYRRQKSNFYFFVYSGLYALFVKLFDIRASSEYPEHWIQLYWAILIINFIASMCLLTGIYALFNKERNKIYWGLFILGLLAMPLGIYMTWGWIVPMMLFLFIVYGLITYLALQAVKRKHKGAKILVAGGIGVFIAWFLCFLGLVIPSIFVFFSLLQSIAILALPLTIAVYVGHDFAMINRSLQEQLDEVERLSIEKQQFLIEQKDMLEKEVSARTDELSQSLQDLKALQNQLIEYETQQALDKERTRIARDMHDDISSGLSAINLLAHYIQNNPLSKNIETEIKHIAQSSTDINQRIREIIWSINSESNNLTSLADFIRRYLSEFSEMNHLICTIQVADDLPVLNLSGDTRRSIFLCVKEALNNTAKYAQATQIIVSINLENNAIAINVQDNGIGFDLEKALKTGGNGLKNMQSRLTQLGGTFKIESDNNGTKVHLCIPV